MRKVGPFHCLICVGVLSLVCVGVLSLWTCGGCGNQVVVGGVESGRMLDVLDGKRIIVVGGEESLREISLVGEDGLRDGFFVSWTEAGQVDVVARYRNGILHGRRMCFHGEAFPEIVCWYQLGVLSGVCSFHEGGSGKLRVQGQYRNGIATGVWRVVGEAGVVHEVDINSDAGVNAVGTHVNLVGRLPVDELSSCGIGERAGEGSTSVGREMLTVAGWTNRLVSVANWRGRITVSVVDLEGRLDGWSVHTIDGEDVECLWFYRAGLREGLGRKLPVDTRMGMEVRRYQDGWMQGDAFGVCGATGRMLWRGQYRRGDPVGAWRIWDPDKDAMETVDMKWGDSIWAIFVQRMRRGEFLPGRDLGLDGGGEPPYRMPVTGEVPWSK